MDLNEGLSFYKKYESIILILIFFLFGFLIFKYFTIKTKLYLLLIMFLIGVRLYFIWKNYTLRKKDKEFIKLVDTIRHNFKLNRIMRDEREFETDLSRFLEGKNYEVENQHRIRDGKDIIDILINKQYVLELKVARDRKELDDCFSKIYWYRKEFKNMALVALDSGAMNTAELKDYVKAFDEYGIELILIKGRVTD